MDLKELEQDLLALCQDFRKHQEAYERMNTVEDTVRGINSLAHGMGNAKPIRDAKELLADLVRELALDSDKAWRREIERVARRIYDEHLQRRRELKDALAQLYTRVRESAINFGDFEDLVPEVESALGIEPENPRETKGDLDFHADR